VAGILTKIAPIFDPAVIIGAMLFSTAVGIFFGIYPAKKAAKLSPIEALRHE
jgi:putative ABC transport system permease protein